MCKNTTLLPPFTPYHFLPSCLPAMPVKIRLARFGLIHSPRYRLLVANSFAKRDGRHLEWIGSYNPQPDKQNVKLIQLNFERVKYWLGVGAQPTSTVQRLFSKVRKENGE
jgi:small subunit ribosomal protein S16